MVIDVCATPTINNRCGRFYKKQCQTKQGLYFPGCLDIYLFLSLLRVSVCLSLTEADEATQYSRLHCVQYQKQVVITKRGQSVKV